MNIVILSDAETGGGAGICTSRLAEGLVRRGHRITRLVDKREVKQASWDSVPFREPGVELSPREWLHRHLERLRPDIVNIHNIHGAVSVGWSHSLVRDCMQFAPTFWTLHDMWSFTGRCAYSYDCRLFENGCDASCPTAEEYPALAPERISPAWQDRKTVFEAETNLIAVTPSEWLASEARKGLWRGHRVEVVRYGLDLDMFRPIAPAKARKILGLPEDRLIFLVVAQHLEERRKGGHLLAEAFSKIPRQNALIFCMGSGELPGEWEGIEVRHAGFIRSEADRVLVYSAADALLHPAPVDNSPNVVMEAMACGTPVVSFPAGGVPELVCGWLAKKIHVDDLAECIQTAIREVRELPSLREQCRTRAEREFGLERQAMRYEGLFGEVL